MYKKNLILFFLLISFSELSSEGFANLKGGLLEKYADEINNFSLNQDNRSISLSPSDEALLKLAAEKSESESIILSIYNKLKGGYTEEERLKYENEIKEFLTNPDNQNITLSPKEEAMLKLAIEKSESESIITSIYNTLIEIIE